MTRILLCIFLILPIKSYLQNTKDSRKEISIRGKATSFFIIEDTFWRNANIGAEFRLNHHSVGIDYVYFRFRYENDSIVDGIEYSNGYNSFSRRDYINLDYRFYPFKNWPDKYGIDPYMNAFVKIGKRRVWSEHETARVRNPGFHPINEQRSNFADYGLALGLKMGPPEFGIDVNMGVVRRISDIWYERGYDYSMGSQYEAHNFKRMKWAFHMRLNIYLRVLNF